MKGHIGAKVKELRNIYELLIKKYKEGDVHPVK